MEKKDFDRATLNLLAIVNNGNLINLPERSDYGESIAKETAYSGVVYEGIKGVANASLHIKGNPEDKTFTDQEGNFSINGSVGDTLIISSAGRDTEFILDENQYLNFSFNESSVQLDEVFLRGKRRWKLPIIW